MRPPRPVPPQLLGRAFSRTEAIEAGVTSRMLQHPRFVEVFPRVYRHEDVELDDLGWIAAAELALPADARASHTTRLRRLGLSIGELRPMHFTIARDLHLDMEDVFVHRTVRMPPCDDHGVAIAPAFIGAASMVTRIELVQIGDWLAHRGLLDAAIVRHLARRDPWRPGSAAALVTLADLDGRSRSVNESQVRMIIRACGLPEPETNGDIIEQGEFVGCGDLVLRLWRLVVEYEGRQHAFSTQQFRTDIDRYRRFRRHDWAYLQVTFEDLARPRALAMRIHDELVRRGYTGPAPVFGRTWLQLFETAQTPAIPRCPASRRAVSPQPHSA